MRTVLVERRPVHDKQFLAIVEDMILRPWRTGSMHRFRDGVSVGTGA